jgi:hypothetical protein
MPISRADRRMLNSMHRGNAPRNLRPLRSSAATLWAYRLGV